jgi:integrase
VTAAGHKSFVLVARFPLNPKNPTRRLLAEHGEITLEQARERARAWLALIKQGIDPKLQEAKERAEALRRQSNTFAAVAGEFLDRHVVRLAKGAEARRVIEAEFISRWAGRPISDIQPLECAQAIRAIVKRGARYQAHNSFGLLRRLFNWAIGTNEFGIMSSPVERLRPADLIGPRTPRDRVLTDCELRAVWEACGGRWGAEALADARRPRVQGELRLLDYPYGPIVRALILTGQRLREVSEMQWRELDLDRKVDGRAEPLWTIPKERAKSSRGHEVPLAPMMLELLRSMPRFAGCSLVFTATGRSRLNGFAKCKGRLNQLTGIKEDWVLHDLRRTVRTHLSALPIEDRVREQMIGHAQPGLHKVYDLHSYQAEKRRGFELWEARLNGILSTDRSSANVVPMRREAAR